MLMGIGAFSSCGKAENNDKIKIVVTVFPEYDWVMNVLGDNSDKFSVKWLLNSVTDMHSYDPPVSELISVYNADLFIYVGGESDEWAKEALNSGNVVKKDMKVLNLMEILGDKVKEEELKEGMQGEDHDHEDHDHEEEEEKEYDEHVWLSLKNASIFVDKIADAISSLDADNAEKYAANAREYKSKLSALDLRYTEAITDANKNTLVFGDRFPFRYLVGDYGLDYYAAFMGCSADLSAKPETIVFLANKVDELGLNVILVIERSDRKIAQAVKDTTNNKNQTIAEMNSLQSVTEKQYLSGVTYLSAMETNLEVIINALA